MRAEVAFCLIAGGAILSSALARGLRRLQPAVCGKSLLSSLLALDLRRLQHAVCGKPRFALIAVGTKNKCKLAAVAQTLAMCPSVARKSAVAAFAVPSGVSDQPMSLDETTRGARSRAEAAYAQATSSFPEDGAARSMLAIGIESGLFQPSGDSEWFDVCVVSAFNGSTHRLGLSCSFQIPPAIMRYVLEHGMDLSEACNAAQITNDPNLGEHGGLIGILSLQRITRLDYTMMALQTSLFSIENPTWY